MKKKAIKIAASTAVAASAFVAAAPAQQADAATNVKQLVTNAQNAGTVLKWAISVEGSADYKTRPYDQFNAAKKAIAAAEAAAAKLSVDEKLQVTAQLVEPKLQVFRATSYIDAITSSEKIFDLTDSLNSAISSADLGKVETAYHAASFEYKTKQAKLLDRVYGQSTRDGIRNAVKPGMEAALESVKYDVTVKMHLDKASALIKDNKLEEAAAELAKADYNLNLKDAKFSFKSQLEKSYADVAAALPLQAISASGDGKNTVTVKFSKAYTLDKNLTTLEAGQFKINGLTVQSAKLSDDKKSVVLTTSTQKADTEYTVTWQGKSVSFKTAAVADTSGITVNETDVAYVEATDSRTYNVKLTNTDGTPYVGRVTVDLNQVNKDGKVTGTSAAVITSVNGQPITTSAHSWTGVTDSNGNLVFTIAAAYNSNADTTSVTYVEPKLSKLDGDKKTKVASVTHFFQLQKNNVIEELTITDLYVSAANDYVYAEGKKYKWDSNDAFFIRGQKVSQEAFEAALSDGDTLTVDYKTNAANVSTWNITVDVTKSANTGFTNPKADVRFDGFNYDLSGKGQAGNTVKVYRGNDLMGTTTVNSDGTWTLRAVNLTQDAANVFEAYQYAPGKDGVKGNNAESTTPAKRTIFEGAFASTGITLTDKGAAGLSVSDELTFSFLNNDKSFGHEFKEDLEGTITVHDNLSRKAVYDVEYVNATTLKIVKVVSADRGFVPTTALTIESTTGVVNQDELAYNVSVSKDKGTVTISSNGAVAPVASGSVNDVQAGVVVVNGKTYFTSTNSVLINKDGSRLYNAAITTAAPGNDLVVGAEATVSVVDGVTTITITSTKAEVDATTALTTAKNLAASKTDVYTAASKAVLTSALNLPESTVAEKNAKTSAINSAVAGLQFAGAADLVTAKANANLTAADYTAVSWTAITLANAKPETTNAEVVAKTTALNDAVAGLVKTADKVSVDAAAAKVSATLTAADASNVLTTVTGLAADPTVTVTLKSTANAEVAANGAVTYASGVTGNVVFTLTKGASSVDVTVAVTTVP